MLALHELKDNHTSNWKLLLVYNIYRLGCVLLFSAITLYEENLSSWVLNGTYFVLALIFFYLRQIQKPRFEVQVVVAGTLDIILQSLLIISLEGTKTWLGILLIFTIAVLSILVPGRLAIFFASVATCMLLGLNLLLYALGNSGGLTQIFYTGIHGAGIFATAITAWFLAQRVKVSENLAAHRSRDLAIMQRINEYIVERLQSGVIYMDDENAIQFMNDAAKDLFNHQGNGKPAELSELSPELDKKYQAYKKKLNGQLRSAKTTIDSPGYIQVHFLPTRVSSKVLVLMLLDDLSLVSQQAQQLKLASLGRFSASIAHELRNPLGAIAHAAQLMGENDPLSAEDVRLKELILKNCNRMNGIIKNVMQLSRREQAHQEPIVLSQFLRAFKEEFIVHKPCPIAIHVPKKDEVPFYFDKSQLEQILVILCDNALAHGYNKKGEVYITIKVRYQGKQVQIMVYDTGSGINEAIGDVIFEPFYSGVRGGNGMGLFIARDLCEINQAKLSLKQTQKGACFMITMSQISEMQI